MAQFQITLPEGLVQGLLSSRNEGLSDLVEQVLNQLLQVQVMEHVGAAPHQRTEERTGYRNGVRERELTTRIGTLTLKVPRVRDGSFSPELFERYQRSEQALVSAMVEMVLCGVSSRKVTQVVEELCGASVSRSTVSSLCQRLDPIVSSWRERDLSGKVYPFVIVDALVIKIRDGNEKGGRVRPCSALIVTGVSAEGYRELLGFSIGDSESEASWSEMFSSLKERGLWGVELVVSDQHRGLVSAVARQFQGVLWQRCQVHFARNVLEGCPKSLREELRFKLRLLFASTDSTDWKSARLLLGQIVEEFSERAPKSVAVLESGFEDALAVLFFPEPYRKRLRSTNSQERLNQEIRRRERVIRIFPNRASAERLLGALLMEMDESWGGGMRYLDMSLFWSWRAEQQERADWLGDRLREAEEIEREEKGENRQKELKQAA